MDGKQKKIKTKRKLLNAPDNRCENVAITLFGQNGKSVTRAREKLKKKTNII